MCQHNTTQHKAFAIRVCGVCQYRKAKRLFVQDDDCKWEREKETYLNEETHRRDRERDEEIKWDKERGDIYNSFFRQD